MRERFKDRNFCTVGPAPFLSGKTAKNEMAVKGDRIGSWCRTNGEWGGTKEVEKYRKINFQIRNKIYRVS